VLHHGRGATATLVLAMSPTVIAASADRVVEQVGSYAGYASIIGLGILALLYFTQAREVKRLREWAGRAPERAAELEERVQADAQKRIVAQPIAPTSAAGQQAAEARAQAATAAVYASVGAQPPGAPPPPGQLARPAPPAAPAPGAVPPVPGAAAPPAPGTVPAPGTLPPGAAPAPAAAAATQAPAPSSTGRPIVTATPVPAPAPLPAATSPAATAAARVAAASRTIAAPGNGSTTQETTESAAARPEPLPAPPAPPPGLISDADAGDAGGGLSRARVGMIIGGAIAVIAIAVVLTVVLAGSDENPPPENNFGNTPSVEGAPSASGAPDGGSRAGSSSSSLTSAERRATDVAVLNGTTQTGLARAVANRIQEDGFTIGGVATNANQSVPTTIVSYTGDHRQAALEIAKIIGIDSGSVQAADANAAAAASGDVLVTVGSDQIE
jgi:hypothetical protein